MGGSSSKTHYVPTGISPQQLSAETTRANNAEKEADDAKLALEKSRRPPDDQIQLCKESKDANFNSLVSDLAAGANLHVAVLALAGAGKSSLFNNVARSLKGHNMPAVRSVGAGSATGGQHSAIISRQNVFEEYLPDWNPALGGFYFSETVGFTGHVAEQVAIIKGLLKPNEIWPRDDSAESAFKREEILKRDPQAPHATSLLLLISLKDLCNASDENDNIIKGIIETAKSKFEINGMPVEIPIIVAITKCDEHTTNPHYNNLLGQRNSENLAPIFKKATERFGIAQDHVIALGWQDESDQTDWSLGSEDPRAMIVRHIFHQLVSSAATCHKSFIRLGHTCPFQVNGTTSSTTTEDANFDTEVQQSGLTRKEFISKFSCNRLVSLLNGKAVATSIIDAILGEGYTGDVFVEDEFIADGFTEEILTKYNINKLVLRSFVRIRDALLTG